MSKIPAMYTNMLACYPALLARLAGVPGVKQVLEAQDLAAVAGERKVLPADGAVYVVFDGFTPENETAARKRLAQERLSFSLILAKRQYTPNRLQFGADGVGETLTAIKSAFQGWTPKDSDGLALALTPFQAAQALSIYYHDGYAFFPVRFTTTVNIQLQDD
ncbi:phage tail terminator protein [Neisseria perflava]|uniref:phage tail terminator protein n=1 Tax=Neisseria perflava TaxID=33053 RepID=UPI0020A130E9|nr:hypothetical protein [Neisseria perflava]MCP1659341.1 hypothetical protein [Neisseria perflava]MCP1772854.1 hypothetical protein [Neisseria perflava]